MFANGHKCFKNEHCLSGFCLAGYCKNPSKFHDPCHELDSKCPSGSRCSTLSHTCVPFNYKRKIKCSVQSDCLFTEVCVHGACKKTSKAGRSCSQFLPDYCEMGSKCAVPSLGERKARCYEQCSTSIPCTFGYSCSPTEGLCFPSSNLAADDDIWLSLQFAAAIFAVLIVWFGIIYAWIRFTRSTPPDARTKKKRVRLQYEGNGLASITMVPSHDPLTCPVAAAQLFNDNSGITQAPPPYSVAIKLPR